MYSVVDTTHQTLVSSLRVRLRRTRRVHQHQHHRTHGTTRGMLCMLNGELHQNFKTSYIFHKLLVDTFKYERTPSYGFYIQ